MKKRGFAIYLVKDVVPREEVGDEPTDRGARHVALDRHDGNGQRLADVRLESPRGWELVSRELTANRREEALATLAAAQRERQAVLYKLAEGGRVAGDERRGRGATSESVVLTASQASGMSRSKEGGEGEESEGHGGRTRGRRRGAMVSWPSTRTLDGLAFCIVRCIGSVAERMLLAGFFYEGLLTARPGQQVWAKLARVKSPSLAPWLPDLWHRRPCRPLRTFGQQDGAAVRLAILKSRSREAQ